MDKPDISGGKQILEEAVFVFNRYLNINGFPSVVEKWEGKSACDVLVATLITAGRN
jgi:hypothetical protein